MGLWSWEKVWQSRGVEIQRMGGGVVKIPSNSRSARQAVFQTARRDQGKRVKEVGHP